MTQNHVMRPKEELQFLNSSKSINAIFSCKQEHCKIRNSTHLLEFECEMHSITKREHLYFRAGLPYQVWKPQQMWQTTSEPGQDSARISTSLLSHSLA